MRTDSVGWGGKHGDLERATKGVVYVTTVSSEARGRKLDAGGLNSKSRRENHGNLDTAT
jgi:hypothetical protein